MHYSIADLEKYSGIRAPTIRIWEQRYSLLTPHRTETNIRLYDDQQLRRLLNVAALVQSGMRISLVCKMSEEEFDQKLKEKLANELSENVYAGKINDLIMAGLTYDEEKFHRTFADCMLRYGLEQTYVNILYTVLKRAGLMWSTRVMNIGQQRYITNLVRQKLYTAADNLTAPKPGAKSWVLFLPEKETQDIGLLYANFLIRQYGNKVYYLGQHIPLDDLVVSVEQISPNHILTFIKLESQIEWAQNFAGKIGKRFRHYNPIVAGHPKVIEALEKVPHVYLLDKPEQLLQFVV